MTVKVITNSLGSGDWVMVRATNDEVVHSNHRIEPYDLVMILQNLGVDAELVEVTDEEMA